MYTQTLIHTNLLIIRIRLANSRQDSRSPTVFKSVHMNIHMFLCIRGYISEEKDQH